MKRFHIHLYVSDLDKSIRFYSRLFGAEPARQESDYAKWMLEDPRVNFAISSRSPQVGIDHLGFQTDNPTELASLRAHAEAADMTLKDEGETTCCYARSEKYWITDPQGIAWEHFHTLKDIPVFRETRADSPACCAPAPAKSDARMDANSCCAPVPQGESTEPAAR